MKVIRMCACGHWDDQHSPDEFGHPDLCAICSACSGFHTIGERTVKVKP